MEHHFYVVNIQNTNRDLKHNAASEKNLRKLEPAKNNMICIMSRKYTTRIKYQFSDCPPYWHCAAGEL